MPSPIEALTQALEGRYRIERELGVGGMATVYLADDLKHDRKVAVKVLKPELAAVLGAERFVVEIKTTASLQHPHILPLFDSGTAAGFLFYVMPFIDGETLRTRLNRETQLGIDEAVRIAREVADALDYAHRHGVIHRDIKPENILLHDGRPMVADFGIALAVSAAAGGRMTETGLSLGTPHYMSPEQATAEKEITARSDIYSIGSVLYEMLAGNPPHTGASAQQIIMKIITEQPQSVTALRRSVPPNVAAAIAKSLEKLPADRFETAKAFADALGNTSFTTTTVSAFAGATRHASWRKTLAAGLLFGALVGALGMVALHRADVRVGERSRAQVTFNGEARTPAISPDGDFVAYVELVCQRGQFAQCKSSLLVQEVGGTQPRALVRDALNLTTPKWTHDGQTLVVAGALDAGRGGLFAISRVSGTAQPIADGALGAYDTHPTGDTVLVMRPNRDSGRALVIALQSGAIVDSVKTPFVNPRDISWSPDGRFIAATEHDALWIADRHGRLLDSVTYSGARGPIRWSVDGRSLLGFGTGAVREDPFVRFAVSGAGKIARTPEVLMTRVPTLYAGTFDIARRTGRLAVGTGDASTDIWSFDYAGATSRARRETHGTSWYGRPDLSTDGKRMYYYRGDALGDNIYQLDRATGAEEALTAERTPGANDVRLSSDDHRLTYARQAATEVRVQHMELPSRRVTVGPAMEGSLVIPMGARGFLLYLSLSGTWQVLDSLAGAPKTLTIANVQPIVSAAASPDGRTIAVVGVEGVQRGTTAPSKLVVGIAPGAGGTARIVATLPIDDVLPAVTWDSEGELQIVRWRNEDEHPSVWRLSVADGALTRVADLAAPCEPASVVVRPRAHAAVCVVRDYRTDIWLFDIAGVTQKR